MAFTDSKLTYIPIARIILAILICGVIATDGLAHEFERGEIERSFEVMVRGDHVAVNWRVGLSCETMADMLLAGNSITQQEHQQFLDQLAQTDADDNSTQPEKAEAGKNGMLLVESSLTEKVEQSLLSGWAGKVSIAFDGQPAKFSSVQCAKSSRHHVNFEVQFLAKLPGAGKHKLAVCDSNFLEVTQNDGAKPINFLYHGGVRKAFRAKGDAMLLNSNVAPVLTRSKLEETRGLDLDRRKQLSTLDATVLLMDKKKKTPPK